MRIFGPTSHSSNAWSSPDPLWNAPQKFPPTFVKDFFTQDPIQNPNTAVTIEFQGKAYEVLVYGEITPDILRALQSRLALFAKVFGPDFLKAASEGQGPLEPRLTIYLGKNQTHYATVLEKEIGYGEKEAKEKAQSTSGIYYFEKNAIAIQSDLPNFSSTLTHEIAHYVDDLLKPRTSEIFCAEDDMFSARDCERLKPHYREQKKQSLSGHGFEGFPSHYGAHGDEGKWYLFEWFAESIKFSVDHFENPDAPQTPDPWMTNDINSLALWTQGKGFATVDKWKSTNVPVPRFNPQDLAVLTSAPPSNLEILTLNPMPQPRPIFLPPIRLRDDLNCFDFETILGRKDWFRLTMPAIDPFHDFIFDFDVRPWRLDIFKFYDEKLYRDSLEKWLGPTLLLPDK